MKLYCNLHLALLLLSPLNSSGEDRNNLRLARATDSLEERETKQEDNLNIEEQNDPLKEPEFQQEDSTSDEEHEEHDHDHDHDHKNSNHQEIEQEENLIVDAINHDHPIVKPETQQEDNLSVVLDGPTKSLKKVETQQASKPRGEERGEEVNHLRPNRPSESLKQLGAQEQDIINELVDRMKPRNFFVEADTNFDTIDFANATTPKTINIPPKQFFHLHHMKSGGSSLNSFLGCGLSRAKSYYSTHDQKLNMPQSRLSECSYSSFKSCTSDPKNSCKSRIENAAYMEYCAPLSAANQFGWDKADAVTVLRHPVDRVWSMFRFQTSRCFKCKNLTDVYNDMDELGMDAMEMYGGGVCLGQLTNHITRNLQSIIDNDDWSDHSDDHARMSDALDNLQNRFTVVGLLERLDETVDLLSHSFPWLKPVLEGEKRKCNVPHVNSSPGNNSCGPNHGHWDLPAHPDEKTRKAIEAHNQLDIKVYEVAKLHFELQLKAAKAQSTNA